jgi:hypothetical protein
MNAFVPYVRLASVYVGTPLVLAILRDRSAPLNKTFEFSLSARSTTAAQLRAYHHNNSYIRSIL